MNQFRENAAIYEDAFKVWRQIYKNLAIDAYDMIAEFQAKTSLDNKCVCIRK